MKDKRQIVLDELSKEPEMVIATAYLYAKNYVHYGEDVTKAWATAVQQNAILEKAYNNGYSDALKEREERKAGKWIYDKTIQNWRCSECSETPKTLGYVGTSAFMTEHFKFCNHCGSEMVGAENG